MIVSKEGRLALLAVKLFKVLRPVVELMCSFRTHTV